MEQDLFVNESKDYLDRLLMLLLSNNLDPYEGVEKLF